MKDMVDLDPSVSLLTILNVASARPSKRARPSQRDWHAIAKKIAKTDQLTAKGKAKAMNGLREVSEGTLDDLEEAVELDGDDLADDDKQDSFEHHWGAQPKVFGGRGAQELSQLKWARSSSSLPGLGQLAEVHAEGVTGPSLDKTSIYNKTLMNKLKDRMSQESPKGGITPQQTSLLSVLSQYRDIVHPHVELDTHSHLRAAAAMHAMNHVRKTRTRILKNNAHLAAAAAAAASAGKGSSSASTSSASTRAYEDQGFTRAKVLVLLPFRNSALAWVDLLTSLSHAETIENKGRFDDEYQLGKHAVDKVAAEPDKYPPDHVANFSGNIDDRFRLGIKVNRKSVKLFAEFYSADVIVASPLGLREAIEKDGDSDFLSSIEVLIVDQMDVISMQNWDHLTFVLDKLGRIPTDLHGASTDRLKPWYIEDQWKDGHAPDSDAEPGSKSSLVNHLRQSILLSAYETPEMRALFNKFLNNLAGRVRVNSQHEGVLTAVPAGVKQVWTRFDANDIYAEDDARFEHFTTKTLPLLRKSAVASSQTLIIVPSYFDYVRLKKHLRAIDDLSFAAISEYSPTPDVSRARGAFFAGKCDFLMVTERFHFNRRYRIRGAKTFVFYAPPEHAGYYPEIISFPFPPRGAKRGNKVEQEEADVDESELSAQVLFSRFDLLRVERIVGSEDAKKMVQSGPEASKFTFI